MVAASYRDTEQTAAEIDEAGGEVWLFKLAFSS